MLRSIRGLVFSLSAAGALVAVSEPANAKLTQEELFAISFDGFHLGMKRSELDRLIALRTDIGEPALAEMTVFDCDHLAPNSKEISPSDMHRLPRDVGFTAAGGRSYGVRFEARPDEDTVYDLNYRERRGIGNWSTYLTEIETRFGKADQVGRDSDGYMFALWCTDREGDCRLDDWPKGPQLSVKMFPHEPTLVYPGDSLAYQLLEGRDHDENRRAAYARLRITNPQEAERLFRQCRSPKGKFRSEEEAERYYVSLMPIGRRASKLHWTPDDVPSSVFTAMGFDRAKISGPGVCFQSMDIFVELPGCTSYSNVSFRWARQVSGLWLVSLRFGGISLRTQYSAVREEGKGDFRKVWWGDLAGFNAWHANGATPMIEKEQR